MAAPIKPPQRPGAPQPEPVPDKSRHATDELADACAALETEVEELKVKYEMYFLGVERNEPNRTREDLKKKVLRLKERFTRNAGIRFRVQSLHARFISYERLWMRSAREKEEGTYRRDLFKARLHAQTRGPAVPKGKKELLQFSRAEDVDLSDFGGEDETAPHRPAAPAAPPAAAKPAAPPQQVPPARPAATAARSPAPPPVARPAAVASAPAVDPRTRALYDDYVAARKRCNQDVSGITPDAIARTIAKQTPEILKAHKARSVEFRVEVKDGRAILKAVPKL